MTAPGLTAEDLRGAPRRQRRERAVSIVLSAAAGFSVLVSVAIVVSLVGEAWNFLTVTGPDLPSPSERLGDLWGGQWAPRFGEYDLRTIFVGSLLVTVVAIALAGPIGLAAAVYLSEYASPRVRKIVKPVLEILAGIPSVVLGFFALVWISPNIVQPLLDAKLQNLGAAGLGVGLLTIPLVASISEDALGAVPDSLREASAGLGARRWKTTVAVVVPAAVSGLVAAFIVAVSRAIGETMVVAIAAGSGQQASFTLDPGQSGTTMTGAMISQARGTDAVAGEGLTTESLYFVGFLLFMVTLSLNLIADRFVRRVRQSY